MSQPALHRFLPVLRFHVQDLAHEAQKTGDASLFLAAGTLRGYTNALEHTLPPGPPPAYVSIEVAKVQGDADQADCKRTVDAAEGQADHLCGRCERQPRCRGEGS
jgi:hypothetical protein